MFCLQRGTFLSDKFRWHLTWSPKFDTPFLCTLLAIWKFQANREFRGRKFSPSKNELTWDCSELFSHCFIALISDSWYLMKIPRLIGLAPSKAIKAVTLWKTSKTLHFTGIRSCAICLFDFIVLCVSFFCKSGVFPLKMMNRMKVAAQNNSLLYVHGLVKTYKLDFFSNFFSLDFTILLHTFSHEFSQLSCQSFYKQIWTTISDFLRINFG